MTAARLLLVDPVSERTRFVTPSLTGTPTGGTLYDARLLEALRARGLRADAVSLEEATLLAEDSHAALWVDSLFLDAMPALARASGGRVRLVLHYLPSLVIGAAMSRVERDALYSASRILLPSPWLVDVVASAGVPRSRLFVVEPGVELYVDGEARRNDGAPLRAVVLANVVDGKGVLPLLRALAAVPAPFTVDVVGSLDGEPAYVAECRRVADDRVYFHGSLSPRDAQRVLADSDVFVSASRMESYGMALAEARALGVPIFARGAGNAPAHVDARAGGCVFDDDGELVAALARLSRDPAERAERSRLAREARRRRTWDQAANDFITGAPWP